MARTRSVVSAEPPSWCSTTLTCAALLGLMFVLVSGLIAWLMYSTPDPINDDDDEYRPANARVAHRDDDATESFVSKVILPKHTYNTHVGSSTISQVKQGSIEIDYPVHFTNDVYLYTANTTDTCGDKVVCSASSSQCPPEAPQGASQGGAPQGASQGGAPPGMIDDPWVMLRAYYKEACARLDTLQCNVMKYDETVNTLKENVDKAKSNVQNINVATTTMPSMPKDDCINKVDDPTPPPM